jgi:imidazolonepropionase-like amidohydrolase
VRLPLAFAALALAGIPAASQTNSAIVLQDVRLIDGTGAPPVEHATIVIQDGKIMQVVHGASGTTVPAEARMLRLTGKTVMPGIINGHGHLGLTKGTTVSPANYTAENVERQLKQYERYGVTTMISLGMNKDLLYELRSRQEKGEIAGATILTADRGIGVPGGMPPVDVGPDQIYRPATPEEARKDVDEMQSRDANLVKIWVDDALHKLPAPKPAVYAAAIDEAHKQHLRAAAHVYYLGDSKQLIQDGIDILAHSIRDQEVDTDAVSLVNNRKVYYIPTLELEQSFYIYARHPAWMDTAFFKSAVDPQLEAELTSPAYKSKVEQDPATKIHETASETAMSNLKKLYEAKALIAFGTDSGATPYRIQGWAEHRELQLMVEAGMKPLEVIHSATAVTAQMLHIEEKTGSVERGKQADLIVLNADPLADIRNTEKIAMVLHNGHIVKGGQ